MPEELKAKLRREAGYTGDFTLDAMIAACGPAFQSLVRLDGKRFPYTWAARVSGIPAKSIEGSGYGQTPQEAAGEVLLKHLLAGKA